MRKPFPSLKNRPWTFYLFFGLYAFLAAFLVVESALPASVSSAHSGVVADIVAFFANLVPGAEAKPVLPAGLTLKTDSSYLHGLPGHEDDVALGTTTMLDYDIEYPLDDHGSYLDPTFEAEKIRGGEEFDLVVDAANSVVRIVSNGNPREDCAIEVSVAGGISEVYSFDIVELPAPLEFSIEVPSSVHVGEAVPVRVVMSDPLGSGKDDYELRRYFDVASLPVRADEGLVIDPEGYLFVKEGTLPGRKEFSIGGKRGKIDVLPARGGDPIGIEVTHEGNLSLNDYDYEQSGILLKASYLGSGFEGVPFVVKGDPMAFKAVPLAENGTFLIKGYRRKVGEVEVRVESALRKADGSPLFEKTITFPLTEIVPASLVETRIGDVLVEEGTSITSSVGAALPITARFLGVGGNENVYDRSLEVSVFPESLARVSGNLTTSPSLVFNEEGEGEITIKSRANPSLSLTVDLRVEEAKNVDPSSPGFGFSIRKNIGHLGLFACLSVLGAVFFRLYFGSQLPLALTIGSSSVVTALLAFLTEGIQLLAIDRGASLVDVGIDLLGGFGGLLLFLAVYLLVLLIRCLIKKKPGRQAS